MSCLVIFIEAALTSVFISALSADIFTSFSLMLDSPISKFFDKICPDLSVIFTSVVSYPI